MPHESDHPDAENPELNPLLNPLLGENMERWAAAYFTAAPEKRDEAVLELLRELQAEHSSGAVTAHAYPHAESATELHPAGFIDMPARILLCRACGAQNAADQRFCGMCGVPLKSANDAASPAHAEGESASGSEAPVPAEDIQIEYLPVSDLLEPGDEAIQTGEKENSARNFSAVSWHTDELSLFRTAAGVDHRDEHPEPETPRFSSRVAVGIALALVIAALAYVGWRGTLGKAANTGLPAPAPAETAPPPASTPDTNQSGTNQSGANQASVSQPAATSPVPPSHPASRSTVPAQSAANAAEEPADNSPTSSESLQAAAGGGTEELAVARKYLDDSAVNAESREQAVAWLWKAVARRNTEATLLLSDVYLKGNGVAKNCEQARVLLDAAAAKGIKAASDRLQHLQSFGCQ